MTETIETDAQIAIRKIGDLRDALGYIEEAAGALLLLGTDSANEHSQELAVVGLGLAERLVLSMPDLITAHAQECQDPACQLPVHMLEHAVAIRARMDNLEEHVRRLDVNVRQRTDSPS